MTPTLPCALQMTPLHPWQRLGPDPQEDSALDVGSREARRDTNTANQTHGLPHAASLEHVRHVAVLTKDRERQQMAIDFDALNVRLSVSQFESRSCRVHIS